MDRARKQALRELEEQKESTIEQVSSLEQEKQQLAQVKQSLLDEYGGKWESYSKVCIVWNERSYNSENSLNCN